VSAAAWFCEYPAHEGDRRIHVRSAQFNKRVTYVRADQGQRIHERNVQRLCRRCADLDAGTIDERQGALF